mmetsp:Transcript_14778/g.33529  ORF Transcript_14778/g.33529 Transcript_14778/m.33529 type:complete len:194 (+) Transcript_14778:49-630(+)
MKTAVFATLLASAAAFAPSANKAGSSALMASPYENEIGALPPIGFWDPAGLSRGKDEATFARYRAVELKHGRVAQLAVLGYVFQEATRFPGDLASGLPFADVPNGLAALTVVPVLGWVQILATVGAVEKNGYLGSFEVGMPDLDAETLAKRQTQEIQHGRLAMLATLELFRHDMSNGADGLGEQLITGLPFLY